MKWMKERDALIAQTMAFVESVTGRKDPTVLGAGRPAISAEPIPSLPEADVPSSAAVEARVTLPAPATMVEQLRITGDVRTEVEARIASFRQHQQRFERERAEYCQSTLAKARDLGSAGSRPQA